MQAVVATAVIVAFFGMVFWIAQRATDIPPGIKDVLLILVGVIATCFKDVVGYFLGSSLGSQRKDDIIRQAGPVP